ncbi:MAG: hypothetical protein QNI84_08055 [Henriciella sp.]|nr:hypothetical protein [Henriciella sp.]
MSKQAELLAQATQADVDRFMKKVKKLPNGCWFWTGGRSRGQGNSLPYGTFSLQGRGVRAHVFAAEVIGKKVCPPGHHRDHTCEFSLCVNPDHIEIVPASENLKRRWSSGEHKK